LSNYSNFLFVFWKAVKSTFLPMFLNTSILNEGGCRDKCPEGKKRELYEGKNPKSMNTDWNTAKTDTHVNSNWQKLRK
jgi:hypothetical protein